MSENKCQMCWKAENPSCEVKDGEYTLQVCAACKDKYEQEQVYKRIQPLVEQLCRELNGCGNMNRTAKAFFDAFIRQHRYLQAEAITMLWKFFEMYGSQPESHYDARNEGAVRWAKKWYESV